MISIQWRTRPHDIWCWRMMISIVAIIRRHWAQWPFIIIVNKHYYGRPCVFIGIPWNLSEHDSIHSLLLLERASRAYHILLGYSIDVNTLMTQHIPITKSICCWYCQCWHYGDHPIEVWHSFVLIPYSIQFQWFSTGIQYSVTLIPSIHMWLLTGDSLWWRTYHIIHWWHLFHWIHSHCSIHLVMWGVGVGPIEHRLLIDNSGVTVVDDIHSCIGRW